LVVVVMSLLLVALAFGRGRGQSRAPVGAPSGKQNAGQVLGDVPGTAGYVHVLGGGGAPHELRCASLLQEAARPGEAVARDVADGGVRASQQPSPRDAFHTNRRYRLSLDAVVLL
jgi:hypothetical protein